MHGVDGGASGRVGQLASQPGDVHVEGVVVDDGAVRPGRLHQRTAADGVSRRRRQTRQQRNSVGVSSTETSPARDRRARRGRAAGRRIDRLVVAGASQQRADPRHQLGEVERLGQEVVAAGAEAGEPVGQGAARRQEENRRPIPWARSAWTTSRPSASGRPMSMMKASGAAPGPSPVAPRRSRRPSAR